MKSLIEINSVLRANLHQGGSTTTLLPNSPKFLETACFLVVDASANNFGKILFANKSLKRFLGYSSEADLKGLNKSIEKIEDLMPDSIKVKHTKFVSRFRESGANVMINNRTSQFLRRSNGRITPVEMFIKFSYSK
jgi:PAS domain S-box-containing protein